MKGVHVSGEKASATINMMVRRISLTLYYNSMLTISKILKVENRHKRSLHVTAHTPALRRYREDTLWSAVLTDVTDQLNRAYMEQFEHPITSANDFKLVYTLSKSSVDDLPEDGTIGQLWQRSIIQKGLLVTEKSKEKRLLELNAIVNYPRPSAFTNLETELRTEPHTTVFKRPRGRPPKRKLTEISDSALEGARKRPSKLFLIVSIYGSNSVLYLGIPLAPSGAGAYQSIVRKTIQERNYTVFKTMCNFVDSGETDWVQGTDKLYISVGVEAFASGKTKRAYKVSHICFDFSAI